MGRKKTKLKKKKEEKENIRREEAEGRRGETEED
jgi:hypothetical protein